MTDDVDFENVELRPGTRAIEDIASLANMLVQMDEEIEALDNALSEAKERRRRMAEDTLPVAMDSVKMGGFRLPDGREIKVEDVVRASIPKEKLPEAFEYFERTGHEDLIKFKIEFNLGRDAKELAQEIVQDILDIHDVEGTIAESVNSNTLSAWCREQIDKGAILPAETLGLYQARVAKLTKPRKPRGK